jgi:hypothetical protein
MGRAAAARRLQAEMRRIYRQRIVPRIERYGTQASAPDRMHRIAALAVDLGGVTLQHAVQGYTWQVHGCDPAPWNTATG